MGLRCGAIILAALLTLAGPAAAVEPPPLDTDVDYQLGGAAAMPAHVGIVVRDRRAEPAAGRYNICYVNGFQTQPDEQWLLEKRMHLVLHDEGGPVVDSAWGEWLLDIRTEAEAPGAGPIVGRWTDRCADDGFDAVEYDNLDSFTRSHGLLERRDAIAFARLLVGRRARSRPGRRPEEPGRVRRRPDRVRLRGRRGVRPLRRVRAATSRRTVGGCW